MKKMRIEKNLVFSSPVKKVLELQIREDFTYQKEIDGIRALGPLYIQGMYESDYGAQEFQEVLEMDVLAPNEKLNGEEFRIGVLEFQANPDSTGIHVIVFLSIQGIQEEQATNTIQTAPIPMPTYNEIKEEAVKEATKSTLLASQKATELANNEVTQEEDTCGENVCGQEEISEIEDLFEDANNTYTSYRIIVAKKQDTYASIASRYEVDENALRETNHNKEVVEKTLVILPYVTQ